MQHSPSHPYFFCEAHNERALASEALNRAEKEEANKRHRDPDVNGDAPKTPLISRSALRELLRGVSEAKPSFEQTQHGSRTAASARIGETLYL